MRILTAIFALFFAINAQGAISIRSSGTWTATSAASVTPAIGSTQIVGDLILLIATGKPYNLTWSAPGDWTSIGRGESGTTAAGVDEGSMVVQVWYKIATADPETDPTVTEGGNSFNVVQAKTIVFDPGGDVFATPVAVFGADESTGTSISVTFASDPGGIVNDYAVLACGINTDSMGPLTTDLTPTWTGLTLTVSGIATEGEGTTGGDMAAHSISYSVTSGTASSAAPTATGTGTASGGVTDRLEAVFIRVRGTTPSTSIKNVMGLDYASVKTVMDLAKASVKSIMNLP